MTPLDLKPAVAEKTVLIIDDNTALLEELHDTVTSAGYRCLTFCDGTRAVNEIRGKKVSADIIIVDISLGWISGLQIVQILKSLPHINHVPFVVMTAYYRDYAELLQNPGVRAFLIKPIAPETLLTMIKELLP